MEAQDWRPPSGNPRSNFKHARGLRSQMRREAEFGAVDLLRYQISADDVGTDISVEAQV